MATGRSIKQQMKKSPRKTETSDLLEKILKGELDPNLIDKELQDLINTYNKIGKEIYGSSEDFLEKRFQSLSVVFHKNKQHIERMRE